MPDIHIDQTPWPPGTSVELYPRVSELHMDDMPPPSQPVIAAANVAADGSLTYAAIDPGSYWAVAPIGGRFQYVAVFSQEGFVPV